MHPVEDFMERLRLALIEIGWRRAMREIKKRGYSVPEGLLRDAGGSLCRSCHSDRPGLLPGFSSPGNGEAAKGICYAGAQWTGEWEAWGWDAEGKYWSVERKVRRSEAFQLVRKEATP